MSRGQSRAAVHAPQGEVTVVLPDEGAHCVRIIDIPHLLCDTPAHVQNDIASAFSGEPIVLAAIGSEPSAQHRACIVSHLALSDLRSKKLSPSWMVQAFSLAVANPKRHSKDSM